MVDGCRPATEIGRPWTHFRHDSGGLDTIPNIAFTAYSFLTRILLANRTGHPSGTGTGKMRFWSGLVRTAASIREFIVPSYHPERHYMRGPGPACARRAALATGQPSFQ